MLIEPLLRFQDMCRHESLPFWYFRLFLYTTTLCVFSHHDACSHTKEMARWYLDTVQLPEASLLICGEASEEAVEVGDHALVCLDDLGSVSKGWVSYLGAQTFWNVSRNTA
jgi:hypothetical protein